MEPDPLPSGYRIGDRYLIVEEIASAEMGRVYRATDSALRETVAINVLAQRLRGTEGRRRFMAAFRTAFYEHRGLVHEYGEFDGMPYVAVVYIEGSGAAVDIAAALAARGRTRSSGRVDQRTEAPGNGRRPAPDVETVRRWLVGPAVVLAATTVVAVAVFSRGSVGPESVVHKQLADLVSEAAAQADARLEGERPASPNLVMLPGWLEPKRRLKRLMSEVGLGVPAPESATSFVIRSRRGPDTLHCVALCRGDRVVGLAVRYRSPASAFAGQFCAALKAKFPGYGVQQSRDGG